jgi:hypothetical protein
MSQAPKRLLIELVLVALALGYLLLWSVGALLAGRAAAHQAADDLAACQRMAQKIELLRRRPALAGDRQWQEAETARLIERAALDAGVAPATSLVRISPESPRRLGTSSFREVPTQVVLRGVTLRQLAGLLAAANRADARLQARSIRIVAPRDEQAEAATWSAEVTLSQFVFSPAEAAQGTQR